MESGWHVPVKSAHRNYFALHPARAGYCCSVAALLIFFGCDGLQNATANGETRTISFHHIHTKEDLTVTYKRNGRYDEEALKKINHLMRDWRESEPIKMDPHLIDVLWEVHREVGATEAIRVICGYRSPDTNSKLRRRSSGVAKFSQHMHGKAIDFQIPGVPLENVRAAGLRAQRGGVGFYPGSGFVHMDTGNVRHWPRMPEAQLASVMAKGQLGSRSRPTGRRTRGGASGPQAGFLTRCSAVATTRRPRRDRTAGETRDALPGGYDAHRQDAKRPPINRPETRRQVGREAGCGVVPVPAKPVIPAPPPRRSRQPSLNIHGIGDVQDATVPASPTPQCGRVTTGDVPSRVRSSQPARRTASLAHGKRLGQRRHQRARLLAGTAGRRSEAPASGQARAAAAPRRSAVRRERRSEAHVQRCVRKARTVRSQSKEPAHRTPSPTRHSPRRFTARPAPPMGSGNARPAVAPAQTTIAVKRSDDRPVCRRERRCPTARASSRARRRSLQRSVDARHDREPERAVLHADHAVRDARTSAISGPICTSPTRP